MGLLSFKHSTMGGGKSAILIAKASLNPKYSLCLKPRVDTRDGKGIIFSRNGSFVKSFSIVEAQEPEEMIEQLNLYVMNHKSQHGTEPKFIFIDEAQFLTKGQVDGLLYFSILQDIVIECYGLLVDFKTELFEGSKRLIEVADEVESIRAYDLEGNPARQNARICDGEILKEGQQVLLGKEDVYQAVSNKKYFKEELEKYV